jgi:hypothetical protein
MLHPLVPRDEFAELVGRNSRRRQPRELVERPVERPVEQSAELEELFRGSKQSVSARAKYIELDRIKQQAELLNMQLEHLKQGNEMSVRRFENELAASEERQRILNNQGNAQRVARATRDELARAREEVSVVGQQVDVVGRTVNEGFSRMDQGFIAMNGHFDQLNINLRNFAGRRNLCFDILNFESIPRAIIKFFSCILAFLLLVLNIARLAFNILREVRNIFYNVLQDVTGALPLKLDVLIKWAMLLVELNFYCVVVQTVGVFFGIKKLDEEITTQLAKLSVTVLDFLYERIVDAFTGSTLRRIGGVFKATLMEAKAIKQLLHYIKMTKVWFLKYIETTKTYLMDEFAAASMRAANKAAEAATKAATDKLSAAATGTYDAAAALRKGATDKLSTAATGTYDAAASLGRRLGIVSGGGFELQDFGLQNLGFLNTTGDTRCLELVSSIFGYMVRNIQKPDEALINYVSDPLVQEKMRIIQLYFIKLSGSQKGGRRTRQRKRSKRIRIRSKKYN